MNPNPYPTLTYGERSVFFTPAEFFHLRDCFGAHGFQPDTETCTFCKEILRKLTFFDEHTGAPE